MGIDHFRGLCEIASKDLILVVQFLVLFYFY